VSRPGGAPAGGEADGGGGRKGPAQDGRAPRAAVVAAGRDPTDGEAGAAAGGMDLPRPTEPDRGTASTPSAEAPTRGDAGGEGSGRADGDPGRPEAAAGAAGEVADWWRTSIIDMEPGRIALRGHPVEELIGRLTFAETIWLMLRGEVPDPTRARLLEAALVAAVDHGPQAPSIAAARMAVTCGLPLNAAMASAVNMLGDVHGGAGEQAVELFEAVLAAGGPDAAPEVVARWRAERGRYLPGFGHRFHPVDPRAPALMAQVERAVAEGAVEGRVRDAALAVEAALAGGSKPVPMNIDGATAVIYAELGFPAPLARGLFCLSRSVGILAHAWEQTGQGRRNKGPTPPRFRWTYDPPP
jgi:citrate synthase